MDGVVAQVLAFIEANKEWAAVIAFFFALAETTAFLSIVIPSTAILIGVGAIVATGALDFAPLWVGASLGALVGSTFSWWLGWAYGDWMLTLWPLNKQPQLAQQGKDAFAKWGQLAVIIGHFFGPLRAVVFLLAGMSKIGFLRFQAVNVIGALAWAFVIPKSGEVGGDIVGWFWRLVTGV